jgi:hypothetical protein
MFSINFVLLAERCMLGSVSDTLGVAVHALEEMYRITPEVSDTD